MCVQGEEAKGTLLLYLDLPLLLQTQAFEPCPPQCALCLKALTANF